MHHQDNKCLIALVGAGPITEEHIKAFIGIENVVIAGIYSRTKSKASHLAKKYSIGVVANSIAELHKRTNANLVVIAVSELSISQVCHEAFKLPWTVLLEKPAGYNFSDSIKILGYLSESNSNGVYVALNRRHYSSTLYKYSGRRIIHVFDQGDIGGVNGSKKPIEVTKNWMYANSIHLVDYFLNFGRGNIIDVNNTIKWNLSNPTLVLAVINFDSGDTGIYSAVWNRPGPWAVTVTMNSRRWEMRPLEMGQFQDNGTRALNYYPEDHLDLNFKPGFKRQAIEAVKASRGEINSLVSLEEAFKSIKLVNQIYNYEY